MTTRLRIAAPPSLFVLGWLLLVDLFLDWRSGTTVNIGGALRMHAGSSGWVGWGALTGAAVVALIVVEAARFGTKKAENDRLDMASAVLGVVILASSLAAFADSSVTMSMGGAVDATTNAARHWPAYAGVVLASAIALVSAGRLFRPAIGRLPRRRPA